MQSIDGVCRLYIGMGGEAAACVCVYVCVCVCVCVCGMEAGYLIHSKAGRRAAERASWMFFIRRRSEELIKCESCSGRICMRDDDPWEDIYQTLCASSAGTRRM